MYSKIIFCLFLIMFVSVNSICQEKKHVIFSAENKQSGHILFPGKSLKISLDINNASYTTKKALRVIGNVVMPFPYSGRGESLFRQHEYHIDDSLDSIIVEKDRNSLYLSGNFDNFERCAYNRLRGDLFPSGNFSVSLPIVKRHRVEFGEKGFLGLRLEVFYKKYGRHENDIYDKPDTILYIPVREGSKNRYELNKQDFNISHPIACVLLCVAGIDFSGECWFEAPRIYCNGKLIKDISFTKYLNRPDFIDYWVGVNLNTRSWPLWNVKVNNKDVFQDYRFDRASNVADFFISLPSNITTGDEIELFLLKGNSRIAYPYSIKEINVIEEPAHEYEIVSVPKYVRQNSDWGILIETNKAGVSLSLAVEGEAFPKYQECTFDSVGLHVLQLRSGKSGAPLRLHFKSDMYKTDTVVAQVVEKGSDDVYLSSGDEIYIDKNYEDYNRFFKWYFSNRIGNWYQFRPSYQWSGTRVIEPSFVRYYVSLLDQLKVPYAWQVEGRALAGNRLNPSSELLHTPMFRGKQAHENDGGYYYWGHFKYEGLYSDISARNVPYGGIFAKHRPLYTDKGVYIRYNPYSVKNMEDGARQFVANLKYSKGESSRHTGPSTLFRYFYQAGYEWLGAEQMYGPEETILSALRGASRAYDRKKYGTLHAMQWGAFPYTDPKHALRHYMSLAVAYMHGSSHLNTEEALWVDEYMNDRYSKSGRAHLYSQHRMLDYIETHTRRGSMRCSVAIIQGRNDAWKSFGRDSIWAQTGEKWKFNAACKSFDLLRVFYPDNIINHCGPDGWFTSTPYGPVDILPIEASLGTMNRYKAIIFLGWNTFCEDDFLRIRDFVFNGGTVLLSAAHLNSELQPDKPVRFPDNDSVLKDMLGENYRDLKGRHDIDFGYGKIIYYGEKCYPIENNMASKYESDMHEIAKRSIDKERGRGWIDKSSKVEFTIWDSEERRTVMLLNTNWKSDENQVEAVFLYGKSHFNIPVRQYHIETIHCAFGVAVYGQSNTTDVISIDELEDEWCVRVQTTEPDTIVCLNSLSQQRIYNKIESPGNHFLYIKK